MQTLSRLNRCNQKMEKNDTFVLDFANTTTEIQTAFDPFYTSTVLKEATDVNAFHDWKDELDNLGVYEWEEVEKFNQLFWDKQPDETLHPIADVAAERFDEIGATLDDEKEADKFRVDFKIKAKQFVKAYGKLACIMPFNNVQWEKLYWYLLFLIPKLKVKTPEDEDLKKLLESIDMNTYAMARVKLGESIELNDNEADIVPQNPNQRGYHGEEDKDSLNVIVENFNEQHFGNWKATPEEKKVKFKSIAKIVKENPDYQSQVHNNPDQQNRRIALTDFIQRAVIQQRQQELDLYKLHATDEDFRKTFNWAIEQMLVTQC